MGDRPFFLRLFPAPVRRWLKEAMRPLASRFLEAYFDPSGPSLDPTRVLTAYEMARFARRFAYSPFADAKCIPMFGDKQAYLLPKVTPDASGSPDGIPVPPRHLWTDCDSAQTHLRVGKDNVDRMREILAASGCDVRPGQRVLDLGCAAGPMLRRLTDFKDTCELWGVDISSEHVHWCMQHFPRQYRWAVTTTAAHLPFEDRFFDLVYCGSVFSHMGEMCDAWLLELARVIRPGGTLYLTMVTREAMHNYLTNWATIGLSQEVRAAFGPDQINSDFDVMVVGRSPWMHAIYDLDFFRRKCEQAFDVLSVTPNVYTYQYALVLRRRETRRDDHDDDPAHAVVVVPDAARSAALG